MCFCAAETRVNVLSGWKEGPRGPERHGNHGYEPMTETSRVPTAVGTSVKWQLRATENLLILRYPLGPLQLEYHLSEESIGRRVNN